MFPIPYRGSEGDDQQEGQCSNLWCRDWEGCAGDAGGGQSESCTKARAFIYNKLKILGHKAFSFWGTVMGFKCIYRTLKIIVGISY